MAHPLGEGIEGASDRRELRSRMSRIVAAIAAGASKARLGNNARIWLADLKGRIRIPPRAPRFTDYDARSHLRAKQGSSRCTRGPIFVNVPTLSPVARLNGPPAAASSRWRAERSLRSAPSM